MNVFHIGDFKGEKSLKRHTADTVPYPPWKDLCLSTRYVFSSVIMIYSYSTYMW